MATPSEILESEILRRDIRPGDRPYVAWDTTQGLTGALRDASIMKVLGEVGPLEGANYDPDAIPPSLSDVLSFYGLKDSKDKKAVDKFLEGFSEKLPQWKKKALSDPKWGESGWETIKKIYQQTVKDRGAEETVEARKKAMRDAPLRYPVIGDVADPLPGVTSTLTKILAPRSVAVVEEGRSPEANEWLRDAAANAAYAVPVSKILGAGNIAKSIAANAIVPTGVAAMDYAADPNGTLAQAGLAALIGSTTNLGLNHWLAPRIGFAAGTAAGKISPRLGPSVRRIFEAPLTGKEKAAQTVKNAASVLEAPETASATILAQAAEGSPVITEADKRAAQAIVDIAKQSGAPGTRDVMAKVLSTAKYPAEKVFDAAGGVASGSKNRLTLDGVRKLGPDLANKILNADREAFAKQFQLHPELLALYGSVKQPRMTPGNVSDVLRTEAFNQLGNVKSEIGENVLKRFGVDVSDIKEKAEKGVQKKKGEAQIADILKGDAITVDDEKWLGIVRNNPDVLQYGYSKDLEGFKRWLLTRGADLLRGTALYRKAWDVE